MSRVGSLQQFIEKARSIHGDKYDYSNVEYVRSTSKVKIICPIHGEFEMTPNNHTNSFHPQGCKECAKVSKSLKQRETKEYFLQRSMEIHGDKYDYSLVVYVNNKTPVQVICPIHGIFEIKPTDHYHGVGCKKCKNDTLRKLKLFCKEEFIQKCHDKFGNKFDLSYIDYEDGDSMINVVCPEHGEFEIKARYFLKNKHGCPKCSIEEKNLKRRLNLDTFIERSVAVHGDKYDYSKVEYCGNKRKVCIICPEHGEFSQTPDKHLNGQGCPKCKNSKLEISVEKILKSLGVDYIIGYTDKQILGKQHLDFYIPSCNIGIECQGKQHFEPVDFAGKGKEWANRLFAENQERDKRKKSSCEKHNLKLYYIGYNDDFENKIMEIMEEYGILR